MKESTKDAVEFFTAQAVAATLELLPGGSALSRGMLAPIEFADRRRTAAVMDRLLEDVAELQASDRLPSIESLASSERFMAVLTSAVRASKATADPDKRRRLRNAVLNSQLDDIEISRAEYFVRLLDRYSELHVSILVAVEPLPPYRYVEDSHRDVNGRSLAGRRDLLALLQRQLGDSLGLLFPAFTDLRNDGLIERTQPVTREVSDDGDPTRPDTISKLGRAFLSFVRDPG